MNNSLMKRIEAAEQKVTPRREKISIVHIDAGLTLEESKMLDVYHGKHEQGGQITQIQLVFVSANDRPARPLDELIRVWDKAVLEAKHD